MSDEAPKCIWCDEPVDDGAPALLAYLAQGRPVKRRSHRECMAREVLGSVGHLEGRCSCYGGTEEDPPGMTRREAARAALELFQRKMGGGD